MRLRKEFLVRIVIARIVSVKLKRRKFKSCDDIECLVTMASCPLGTTVKGF